MKRSFKIPVKYPGMIMLTVIFLRTGSLAAAQKKVSFSPENFLGNRSNNYQHLVRTEISKALYITNFAYLDSDYRTQENLYNFRNTLSYSLIKGWASNLAFGVKNPGFYSTVSIQYNQKNDAFSYIISSGATYQKDFTSESFASIQYTPQIKNDLMAFIKATFSFNINSKGVTRGIQQFRFGIKNKQLIYGWASNFDQFNYNQRTLTNHGLFLRISY